LFKEEEEKKEGETVHNTHVLLLLCASELETHPRFLDFLSKDQSWGSWPRSG